MVLELGSGNQGFWSGLRFRKPGFMLTQKDLGSRDGIEFTAQASEWRLPCPSSGFKTAHFAALPYQALRLGFWWVCGLAASFALRC